MNTVFVIVHVLACIGLVLIVLLQTGKGASLGAAFGGASNTVFGSSGATTFLAKMTTGVAVLFMITSLSLAIFSGRSGPSTVMTDEQRSPAATTAPANEMPPPPKPEPISKAPAKPGPAPVPDNK